MKVHVTAQGKNRSASVLAALFAASLLGVACNDVQQGPIDETSTGDVETLTREMDTQVAHATKASASQVRVDIISRTGALQFSVEINPGAPDEQVVAWSIPADVVVASAGGVTSGTLVLPLEQLPTLDDSVNIAILVQSRVIGSMNGQPYDNWGCDLPFTNVASCSLKGACCDTHDACYARNGCSSSSWWVPWPITSRACQACNAVVTACIASTIYYPGPSVCCSYGNCGQPR